MPASVSLDGAALKHIREERRLTQLYVSKVVGVTTDTISRWENNRYPSMRRENALKLAEALEVTVEDLLRKPEVPVADEPPGTRHRLFIAIGLVAVLIAVAVAVAVWQTGGEPPPPPTVSAARVLPPYAAPGTAIPVRVRLVRRVDDSGFILRETLPKGWKLLQASPPASSLDNDTGMARWIIKSGDPRDRVVYVVQVSAQATPGSFGEFHGEVVVGGGDVKTAVPIDGDTRTSVAPVLWADLNGDGKIDDSEMLQASYTVDEMAGVHIDWLELERFWNAGGYRWDDLNGRFLPAKPSDIGPSPEHRP